MKEPTEWALNSLILTGLTLRTFSTDVSVSFAPVVEFVQEALATISPLKGAEPEVTLNVALMLAPGAMGPEPSFVADDFAVQPFGVERLNLTPVTGAPVVL